MKTRTLWPNRLRSQSGVALYVVSVALMLGMLLALWASRTSWLLEMVTGNEADYHRAFEAAQAMMEDAQYDIALHLQAPLELHTSRSSHTPAFPHSSAQWATWVQHMSLTPAPHCVHGLCLRRIEGENFWENEQELSSMLASGARYGSYSGKHVAANPLLATQATDKGAWYWIEPMLMPAMTATQTQTQDTDSPQSLANTAVAFRITALAFGIKGNDTATGRASTMAVLQSMVVAAPEHLPNYANRPLRTMNWRQLK